LNNEGQVIGVNTAKASAEGMGFAIPINTAKPIIDKVIDTGAFERVYIGVSAADAQAIAEQYPELNVGDVEGAFIMAVSGDSPANKAGLKMKDIITKVDGKAIDSSTALIKSLLNYSAGDEVTITYIRDGKETETKVTLGSQSDVYGEWNSGTQPESGDAQPDPYSGGVNPYEGGEFFENPFGDQ
jgi:S1-C subfamily serine protease